MKHYSKEEKALRVEDRQKSGKGAWTYAKENGLIPQTFVNWTKKKTEKKNNFVQIRTRVIAANQGAILVEKGDVKIHIPLSAGSSELRTVLECLGRSL